MPKKGKRIGFVSTRLAGTDGVSLEVVKWVKVLEEALDHACFYFAGESEWPEDHSYLVPEAHFEHPEVKALTVDLFDDYIRSPETSATVEKIKNHLKKHLHQFVRKFDLELIIIENAMAIPMNVPLGLALTEFLAETNLPAIGHHHDFAWERSRYSVGAADDYLRAAFPATLHSIIHAVINSFGQSQLALRTGASSIIVPNVMDFESAPPVADDYVSDLRKALGIGPDEYFLLQPTRVVPRKRIERAIELAKRLEMPCTLVISHDSGDEGSEYLKFLKEYIDLMGVKTLFASDIFSGVREQTPDGRKIYSLADAHHPADLITYPSSIEGFGNAFLEAIYYRKPIVMSAYDIFKVDIRPKGFDVVDFDDYITEDTVQRTRNLLTNPDRAAEMVAHNYEVARHHYSYRNLEILLDALVSVSLGSW
jgi:glycosyltransferase involved in cell wall biosynthesis